MTLNPFSLFNTSKTAATKDIDRKEQTVNRNYDSNVVSQLIDSESILNKRLADLQSAQSIYDTAELDLSNRNSTTSDDYRRKDNWRIAYTPEIAWCIDEIMSELLDINISVKCGTTYNTMDDKTKQIVENEFNRFIALFDYNSEQFHDDLRHFIVDGDLAYESIISEDNPEFGVIGIRRLYADAFNVVYSPIIKNGFVLNISVDSLFNQTGSDYYNNLGHLQSRLVLNKETNSYETDERHVALTFPDVTHICYDKDVINNKTVSIIDKAREPYFQLAALQQAAMVLRITRAPERLLFNIDTHGMSDKLAAEHIRKFGNALSKKKAAGPNGDVTNTYSPATMLESWIFGKSDVTTGTTVSSVTSTANFNQLDDINYFHNRVLNVFKIPFSRITAAEKQYVTGENLTYDECRFYKFIQSMQIKFSNGLTKLFLHDLKIRGIDVDTTDVKIEFDPPERYTTYLNNQIIKNKFEVYEAFANREEFNKPMLMHQYLDMSLTDIHAHLVANTKAAARAPEGSEGSEGSAGGSNFSSGGGDFGGGGVSDTAIPDDGADIDDDIDGTGIPPEPSAGDLGGDTSDDNTEEPTNNEEEPETKDK